MTPADSDTARSDSFGPPREKTVSWHDPQQLAASGAGLTGREFLSRVRDGLLPPPPIANLMMFSFDEIDEGRVVFRCVPDESVYNPIGVVHGGLVCTLLDSVLGCAVHSLLDVGVGYTSIDLNVSFLRPVHAGSTLTATGTVTKMGRRVAFATGEVRDQHDTIVATATSSLLIMDGRAT